MRPSSALLRHRGRALAVAAALGARNLRVFGSAATGEDTEGSDLDLLVDLPSNASLLDLARLQIELEAALGVRVDVCTESSLEPRLKASILAKAKPV
jgi:predicted nucleotidyltransferase